MFLLLILAAAHLPVVGHGPVVPHVVGLDLDSAAEGKMLISVREFATDNNLAKPLSSLSVL